MFKAGHVLDGAFANQTAAEFFPAISANYSVDEAAYLTELLQLADPGEAGIAAIRERARTLIEAVRARDNAVDTLDALLRQYSLDTQEGLMLMCLAEALLRVPDAATADALIRDKLNAAEWERHLGQSDNVLVNFAAWGLVMTGKVVDPETADGRPKNVIGRLLKRSGEPVIRAAMNQAMKLMGKQFVLGRTIAEALKNGRPEREKGYTYSFDMLGEAALTAEDAAKYMADYRQAVETVGAERGNRGRRAAGRAGATTVGVDQAVGAAPALRSRSARAGAQRAVRQRPRASHPGPPPGCRYHYRCRGSRPPGAVARTL